jgi:5S rRNA maturation endonuclease (ribonuclease M5)
MADDGLDFLLLTPEEREAEAQETAPGGEPHADKPMLPPGDAEPAETAAARLFRHSPDAIWRYATAEGQTAFFVCRYKKPDGRKDFLPLCWFPGDGWRSKHWPAPRPLYNLDKLDARFEVPVIICEGEKSADAAARIFVECIAITASGGAKAADQTDWTPLAGRQVRIWPDADSPGEKYARQVETIVADLECEVAIIDAAALARIDPSGGQREPPKKGWDAADAIDEWPDLDALRKAATGLAKPFEPGPAAGGAGLCVLQALHNDCQGPHRRNRKGQGRRQDDRNGSDLRARRNPGRVSRSARPRLGQSAALARRGWAPARAPCRGC